MPSPCLVSGQFAQLSGAVSSAVVVGQSSRLSSLETEVGCGTSLVFYSKEEKSRWDRKNAMQSMALKRHERFGSAKWRSMSRRLNLVAKRKATMSLTLDGERPGLSLKQVLEHERLGLSLNNRF